MENLTAELCREWADLDGSGKTLPFDLFGAIEKQSTLLSQCVKARRQVHAASTNIKDVTDFSVYHNQLVEALTAYVEAYAKRGYYYAENIELTTDLFKGYDPRLQDTLLGIFELCAGHFAAQGFQVAYRKVDCTYFDSKFSPARTTHVEMGISWFPRATPVNFVAVHAGDNVSRTHNPPFPKG